MSKEERCEHYEPGTEGEDFCHRPFCRRDCSLRNEQWQTEEWEVQGDHTRGARSFFKSNTHFRR